MPCSEYRQVGGGMGHMVTGPVLVMEHEPREGNYGSVIWVSVPFCPCLSFIFIGAKVIAYTS